MSCYTTITPLFNYLANTQNTYIYPLLIPALHLLLSKWIRKIKKIAHGINALVSAGLLEEDEEQWSINAGVTGGSGRPQWQIGIGHTWEEEELDYHRGLRGSRSFSPSANRLDQLKREYRNSVKHFKKQQQQQQE